MDFDAEILDQLHRMTEGDGSPREKLEAGLRLLGKWRAAVVQNTVVRQIGAVVQGGPFAGMRFVETSTEGCHVPKLLGCYESELHDELLAASRRGYRTVLNIGAAEGYYAVGMARLMPQVRVLAFDSSAAAREACMAVAMANGVADRVKVDGEFNGDMLDRLNAGRTLVICDIEGAELEVLDPARHPPLRHMDLIVEIHELFDPAVRATILGRFGPTHTIRFVDHAINAVDLPPLFDQFGHLDQLLAIWEWRSGPTPWAVMLARAPNPPPSLPPATAAPAPS